MYRATRILILGCFIGGAITVSAAAEDGSAKAQVCAACHGADGNSINPDWPNLAAQHPTYIQAQLQAFKSGARKNPNMTAMAAPLSDQDITDLAAYFSKQTLKIESIDAAQVDAGAKLYRGGNKETGVPACMACHGPNGAGNYTAKFPSLRGQRASYTAIQLKAYRTGDRTTDPQGMMRTIASRLTDAEIDNLAKYVSALH